MADKEGEETGELFSNDGNFLERFKKLEEEKKKKEEEKEKKKLTAPPGPTIPGRRKNMKLHPPGTKKSKVSTVETETNVNTSNETTAPSTSEGASKPKRKSRWGDWSQPSTDEQLVMSTINSFSTPNMDERIQRVQQQIIEQQELHRATIEIQKATRGVPQADREAKTFTSTEKEHMMRAKEMEMTAEKSEELTTAAQGKHFIGDFLPPEEFLKFMERTKAAKDKIELSDYNDKKLTESNIGYKMLQKAGWKEGEGLGSNEDGIKAPIKQDNVSVDHSGVGMSKPSDAKERDDEFDVFRKRMMLAYRFRPNPLNNPRRPYY
ncbi:PREDICTED: SURP and G-patch domain-containing protein 1-like [Amphimedon queenslandica]|uniref:G-patch domain-containing protein n=1 Tax=Amphimedon queenslandica TaxID=400682 RepID=A0A1X7UUQ1_AMPQE|nr:PREDICTED: SURP and G-patch domain-containing protein 1-like [Amphimedon queenslandica]|eukprot:XP_019852291.1 PREDICTED: SURP and G-patch domain-containing protein 1-like [Amphimedon queenslandica]